MSLFGSLMGDFDDDIFGNQMNAMNMQMRSMNRLMNSLMPDPFNMLAPFDQGFQQNALMERPMGPPAFMGFPGMPNMNRLLMTDIGNPGGASFCSSSVITMSSGPDGRPQIYQATSSTKTGPGGVRETRRTVQDSVNGVKKMAIGHHIGERAHIIEKEQDLRSGQLEERQEFINLEEDDAEDFDREFTSRASSGRGGGPRAIAAPPQQTLTIEPLDDDEDDEVVETTNVAANAHPRRPHHSQHQRPSSSGGSRRYLTSLPASQHQQQQQQQQHHHQQPSAPHHNSSNLVHINLVSSPSPSPTPSSSSPTPTAAAASSRPQLVEMPNDASDSTAHQHHSTSYTSPSGAARQQHTTTSSQQRPGGISARRPIRTAPSSPLATKPTMHNHSTASSPSVHPHPYNTAAARRPHHHHHRSSKHGGKHHGSSSSSSAGGAAGQQ